MDERYRGNGTEDLGSFSLPRTVCNAEEETVRRLAFQDSRGARAAAAEVLDEVIATSGGRGAASYLLYDFLSQVDRASAETAGMPQRGIAERLALIRRLAEAATIQDLKSVFWSSWDDITGSLDAAAPPGHPAVEQVKIFVRKNFTHKIALSHIASAVGVSRNYLSHLFKRHCGLTVTEFIHRTRMKEAEKLLTHGGKTVSEIAYLVGYQNYRDFHRNFVKYQKTSPKKYRQYKTLRIRAQAVSRQSS